MIELCVIEYLKSDKISPSLQRNSQKPPIVTPRLFTSPPDLL